MSEQDDRTSPPGPTPHIPRGMGKGAPDRPRPRLTDPPRPAEPAEPAKPAKPAAEPAKTGEPDKPAAKTDEPDKPVAKTDEAAKTGAPTESTKPVLGAAAATPAVARTGKLPPVTRSTDPVDETEEERAGWQLPGPPWLVWAIAGAVALVVVVVAVLALGGGDEPSPPEAVVVQGPEPTPVADPVVRGEGSALFLAQPDAVRQYVLTAIAPSDAFAAAAALESLALTYVGPLDGVDATYSVAVGQWPTPQEAAAQAAALVALIGAPTSSGEVTVGGAATGTFAIVSVDDATSSAVWSNGTVVVQATGPAADIENFYRAYSL